MPPVGTDAIVASLTYNTWPPADQWVAATGTWISANSIFQRYQRAIGFQRFCLTHTFEEFIDAAMGDPIHLSVHRDIQNIFWIKVIR